MRTHATPPMASVAFSLLCAVVTCWKTIGAFAFVVPSISPSVTSRSTVSTANYGHTMKTASLLLVGNPTDMPNGLVVRHGRRRVRLGRSFLMESTVDPSSSSLSTPGEDAGNAEEWEEVEYDMLTEEEFAGSEWLVGSVMDRTPERIDETWVRLATDRDGKNVAIWGDKAEGTWSFDVASQFLSFSKDSLVGKAIWAGIVDDFYYTLGTIRGYNLWTPAAVLGQWQAKRLGVAEGEAGVAPWFKESSENGESEKESDSEADNDRSGSLTVPEDIEKADNESSI